MQTKYFSSQAKIMPWLHDQDNNNSNSNVLYLRLFVLFSNKINFLTKSVNNQGETTTLRHKAGRVSKRTTIDCSRAVYYVINSRLIMPPDTDTGLLCISFTQYISDIKGHVQVIFIL